MKNTIKQHRHTNHILIVLAMAFLIMSSCTDIYDNIREYADSETIYADKLDGIIKIQIGYERVEIDLMQAGRIPASRIKMGKAKKTVIECPDFEEEGHRRVIDSICSWVNITGLTELKNYQFTIYTEDEYGNRSLALKAEARPFTKENLDALALTPPVIVESSTAALMEWKEPISGKIYTIYRYAYEYTDKDGMTHRGGEEGDLPSFFIENVTRGTDIPVKLSLTTIPTIAHADGTYTPILDSINWQPEVKLRISENASPAIFLKTPKASITMDVNNLSEVYPLNFSWTTVEEATEYLLKVSSDPNFSENDGKTFNINVGSKSEYVMDEAEGLSIINSFPKSRQKELYWTVVPAAQSASVTTQVRRIITTRTPILLGKWTFDNPNNLASAEIGEDLVSVGSGIVSVAGPSSNDKAAKISKGSYYKCLHGLPDDSGDYTVMLNVRYPETGIHSLIQTNSSNTDAAEFMINSNGNPGIEGIGYASNYPYSIGPGSWHRIFVVASQGAYKIYIDGELTYTGGSGDARYLLMAESLLLFADGTGNDNDIEVAEIALWDLALEVDEMLEYNNLKLVNRREFSIASFSGELPTTKATNAINGSPTGDPWSTNEELPNWIVIDLGKTRNIGRFVIYTSTWSGANLKTAKLMVGMNQTNWTQVGELTRGGASVNPWGCLMSCEFPDKTVNGRFLRIEITERYGTHSSIGEVIVYEKTN